MPDEEDDSLEYTLVITYVTLSYLGSKEITGVHKPCILHSNDSRIQTSLYSNVTQECGGHQLYTTSETIIIFSNAWKNVRQIKYNLTLSY